MKIALIALLLFVAIPPTRTVDAGEGLDHLASVAIAAIIGWTIKGLAAQRIEAGKGNDAS